MKVLIFVTIFSLFASSTFAADAICAGVPSGNIFLFPYPGDCSRYYRCDGGDATVEQCPGDLWFNEAIQSCDHRETSGCSNVVCLPGVVDYFPTADCSQYIECYNGVPETHTCENGLWFNPIEKRCVDAHLSQCGQYTDLPPWTTPQPDCYGVLPGEIVLRPYPTDCSKYIECIGSTGTVMSCDWGFYFNSARQMCDYPDVSGCDDTTGTPWTPGPTVSPPPAPFDDPRCADGNNDYWPDVECHQFVECYQGHGYLMECNPGMYFDDATKTCVDPRYSSCGRTEPTYPTHSTDPNWTPNPYCPYPTPDRYLYPFVGHCSKYLECADGELIVMNCPPDLWFNPTLLVCDYPYHSGCIYNQPE